MLGIIYQLDNVFLVGNPSLRPSFEQSNEEGGTYKIINENHLSDQDILLLGLALVPHFQPNFLNKI
jgi:hypothetical protein